jgi:hypothetical protein
MNIIDTETSLDKIFQTSLDKKDITLSELNAYEKLLEHTKDASDEEIIESEIAELRMTLDLLP